MSKLLMGVGLLTSIAALSTSSVLITDGLSAKEHVYIPKLSSAKDIKETYKNIPRIKDNFKQIDWSPVEGNTEVPNYHPLFTKENKVNGWLIVEHQKEIFEDNRWKGDFRLIWTLSDIDNSFIMSVNAKTQEGKLFVDSAIYIMKRQQNKRTWIVTHSHETEKQEAINNHKLSELIPKPGTSMKAHKTQYWNFNPDLDKICQDNECTIPIEAPNRFSSIWKLKETPIQPASFDWCDKFNNWFMHNHKTWSYFETKIQRVSGNWIKK